eukprot:g13152.t1
MTEIQVRSLVAPDDRKKPQHLGTGRRSQYHPLHFYLLFLHSIRVTIRSWIFTSHLEHSLFGKTHQASRCRCVFGPFLVKITVHHTHSKLLTSPITSFLIEICVVCVHEIARNLCPSDPKKDRTFPYVQNGEKEGKKEDFQKYLEKSGVMDALTKVLVVLYETEDKPSNAIEFLKETLATGGAVAAEATTKAANLAKVVEELKKENRALKDKLAETEKELASYKK